MTHHSLALLSSADGLGAILVFMLFFVLVMLVIAVVLIVSMWKVYEKAGAPGWAVLVPFYNQVKMLEITGKPLWWVLLLFTPIVNIFLLVIMARRLAACFGKGVGFTWGLVLLPFIFYPILAFENATYSNTFPPAKPMSEAVKWSLAAGFLFLLLEGFSLASLGNSASLSHVPLTVISSDLGYASDDNYVYYYDTPIHGADPLSFKVEGAYGMDDTSVYYEDTPLPNVDPSSFKALGTDGYGVDKSSVYYDGDIIDADPSTFTLATDPSGNDYYDAKDANSYYSYGEPVTKDGKSLTQ